MEETEYWVAYEPPSQTAFSLAWGDGHLWMSDFFSGMVYELEETDQGLNIVSREDAKQVIGTHFEARDLTWDGNHLWSVGWAT